MIRFRPHRDSLSASVKDELLFCNLDELLQHVHSHWGRVVAFMGGKPFRMDEIIISASGGYNPLTGYNDERMIAVTRMADRAYPVPMCIGYCDLGA